VRYAADKLAVISGIIEAGVNHFLDQISEGTSRRIGSGIRNSRVDAIDQYRRRKITGRALINGVFYSVAVGIDDKRMTIRLLSKTWIIDSFDCTLRKITRRRPRSTYRLRKRLDRSCVSLQDLTPGPDL
jgi:hypothetical protein